MFTGIIEEIGRLRAVEHLDDTDAVGAARLVIAGPRVVSDARPGDSIAVSGVCLTVTSLDREAGAFGADVMGETLRRTTLGSLSPGAPINLERAVPAGGRLGGHIVQGHVDGVVEVLSREHGEHWDQVRYALPPGLARYVAEKGSVTLDGTSLTVTDVDDDSFGVGLIPTTLEATTHGTRRPGDRINLEVDVLAKYVERLIGQEARA